MKVQEVYPCVCSIDDYEEGQIKSSDYGMPLLSVCNSAKQWKQYWSIWCPKCGRGSKLEQFDSQYLALKSWNKMQANLYLAKERGLFDD